MEKSVFTKIIEGELPSHRIYEDDEVIAILDIHPVALGHSLVISKKQIASCFELDDADYEALWRAVRQLVAHLKQTLGVSTVIVHVDGRDIAHAHVHLVPVHGSERIDMSKPLPPEAASSEILQETVEKIRVKL